MRRVLVLLLGVAALTGIALYSQCAFAPITLALVDRGGAMTELGTLPGSAYSPRLSPDGRRVAFDTTDGSIWVADIANLATPRRVAPGRFPMWSADGGTLMFAGADGTGLFSQPADGSGTLALITREARAPEHWSAAAQVVSYLMLRGDDYDVWVYSLRDRSRRPLVAAAGSAQMGSRLSPDGRWLLYESDESGRFEIYLEPLPRTGSRTQVTQCRRPAWALDA